MSSFTVGTSLSCWTLSRTLPTHLWAWQAFSFCINESCTKIHTKCKNIMQTHLRPDNTSRSRWASFALESLGPNSAAINTNLKWLSSQVDQSIYPSIILNKFPMGRHVTNEHPPDFQTEQDYTPTCLNTWPMMSAIQAIAEVQYVSNNSLTVSPRWPGWPGSPSFPGGPFKTKI